MKMAKNPNKAGPPQQYFLPINVVPDRTLKNRFSKKKAVLIKT